MCFNIYKFRSSPPRGGEFQVISSRRRSVEREKIAFMNEHVLERLPYILYGERFLSDAGILGGGCDEHVFERLPYILYGGGLSCLLV